MANLIPADQKLIDQQIDSERESDFDSNSAYGEVIDNSIQAGAENIKINFKTFLNKKKEVLESVAFGDDGKGMSPQIVENCLTQGFSTRYNDRDGIGRFGVGMTKAFMNQCLVCEIYSKEKDQDWYYTKADIKPNNPNKNEIPKAVQKNPPLDLEKLGGKDSGTIVVWSEHDKQDGKPSDLIDDFKIWVGRTYRKFIFKGLKILINNEEVKSIDPTFMNVKTSKFPDDPIGEVIDKVIIPWPIDPDKRKSPDDMENISVTITLAPEELRKGRADGKSNTNSGQFKKIQQERYMDDNWHGVSILRNDREVFFGYPHPWTGNLDLNQPRGRWVGFEISFTGNLDKSFVVKNIKTGAKPVKELKKAITSVAGHLFKNACNKVSEQWDKYEAEIEINNRSIGTSTGHEEAENIANRQKGPKDRLTVNKDENELNNKALDILDEKNNQARAAWEIKFKSQPYTIVDSEWRGDDFVQIAYTRDGAVMKYNLSHPLHKEIISICSAMEKETEPDKLKSHAQRLKKLNDLILLSFCKAEKQNDETIEISNTEDFLEDLRLNWGRYLKRYVNDSKD